MIERWLQFTCDGCEETEFAPLPDMTIAEVMKEMGVQRIGGKQLCRACARQAKEGGRPREARRG